MSGAIINVFQTFSTYYQLNFMLQQTCNTEQIVYDMTTWCMTADCQAQTLLNNILARFFQITGAINSMLETIYNTSEPITNTAAYFKQFETAGQSVGKIIRIIFNYSKWILGRDTFLSEDIKSEWLHNH